MSAQQMLQSRLNNLKQKLRDLGNNAEVAGWYIEDMLTTITFIEHDLRDMELEYESQLARAVRQQATTEDDLPSPVSEAEADLSEIPKK